MKITDFLGSENTIGIDIWNKKYRFKTETFDQFMNRITNGNDEIKKLILEKKFIYAGRILANRGLQKHGVKVTYSNCFTPDAKVLTSNGLRDISTVNIGDKVYTADGTFQQVNNILINDYTGDIVHIESKDLLEPINATPNHKVSTADGWVAAEELLRKKILPKRGETQYKISVPFTPYRVPDETIDLAEFLSDGWADRRRLVVTDDLLYTECDCIGGNGAKVTRRGASIKRFITVDSDVRYLLGRYIGDGSLTPHQDTLSIFQIVFNANNEKHAYDRIKSTLEVKLGLIVTDNSDKNQHTLVVKVSNTLFGMFIMKLVNRTTAKHLPERYFGDIDVLCGIFDSDGTVASGRLRLVMKNKLLVKEIQQWLAMSNIIASYKDIIQTYKNYTAGELRLTVTQSSKILPLLTKKYEDDRLNISGVDHYTNNYKASVIPYSGKVYNLSVEVNHNYIVNGALVHNCYVIAPAEDNLESIYETDYKIARTESYGGGAGTDVSKLSPAGARINNAAKSTSGVVSFMEQFAYTTARIAQNGRRGALMLSIDCNHPDLEEFIAVKGDLNKIVSANISIRIDDEFMRKVENDEMHTLSFTRQETGEVIEKQVNARGLFKRLAKMNWRTAEPGILFWDRINKWTLLSEHSDFEFAGVNPCAR